MDFLLKFDVGNFLLPCTMLGAYLFPSELLRTADESQDTPLFMGQGSERMGSTSDTEGSGVPGKRTRGLADKSIYLESINTVSISACPLSSYLLWMYGKGSWVTQFRLKMMFP